MISINKKRSTRKKILLALLSILGPTICIIMGFIILLNMVFAYFSSAYLTENLSESENTKLVQAAKDLVNEKTGQLKDYYGTDKRYTLQYQYIVGYMKYLIALKEQKGENFKNYDAYINEMKEATSDLWPKMSYVDGTITTIREYKVLVKKFKDIPGGIKDIKIVTNVGDVNQLKDPKVYEYNEDITYKKVGESYEKVAGRPQELNDIRIYDKVPEGFKADNYNKDQKIYIIEGNKYYSVDEEEETRIDRKEEHAEFITRSVGIKGTYNFKYENKEEVLQKDNEKITTIKPVLTSISQEGKDWDGLRTIISQKSPKEDVSNALEVILASAASLVNDKVTEDMIYTGGGVGTVTPEAFSGGQVEFIQKIVNGAQEAYKKYHILPSITIAQAILESGWGQSGLTKKANNLFGVKAFSSWPGATVEMMTQEYDGGGSYSTSAKFRAYASWDESIDDHSKVLMQSNFSGVRAATTYIEAATALVQGGYATDPEYAQLIISLVEKYQLYIYDK